MIANGCPDTSGTQRQDRDLVVARSRGVSPAPTKPNLKPRRDTEMRTGFRRFTPHRGVAGGDFEVCSRTSRGTPRAAALPQIPVGTTQETVAVIRFSETWLCRISRAGAEWVVGEEQDIGGVEVLRERLIYQVTQQRSRRTTGQNDTSNIGELGRSKMTTFASSRPSAEILPHRVAIRGERHRREA